MTLRHLTSVAVCATALLLASQAAAQSWPPLDRPTSVEKSGEKDVALLIGIEDYTYLPDVEGAAANLADWERFLRQDLGLKKVMVLRDENATREEILRMADRAASETTSESRLWVVFVGHGAPQVQTGEPLLVGVDGQATPNSVAARGVLHSELTARLEKGAQANTIALLDACFSGKDADGEEILEGVQPVVPATPTAVGERTTLLSAAAPNQVAGRLPGTRRPAFSYLVLGGLRGWADDGDGEVTAAEAVEFSRVELLGVPGRDQTPVVSGNGDVVLSSGASEARPTVLMAGNVSTPTTESNVAPSDDAATATVEASTPEAEIAEQPGDGEFDFPLFMRVGIGTAGTPDGPAQDLGGEIGIGWKFDGPSSFEWRAILGAKFASYRQFKVGDEVTLTANEMTATGQIDEGNPLLNRQSSLIAATLGPGFAWRSEKTEGGLLDQVVSAEVYGLLGYVENYCDPENVEVDSNGNLNCGVNSPLTAGIGARVGYTWKFLDVGLSASYAFASDNLVFISTVGFALDP